MQIQVHDPMIRERRRSGSHLDQKKRSKTVKDCNGMWIDLDENILDNYILIDDRDFGPLVPEIDGEEAPCTEDTTDDGDSGDDRDDYHEDTSGSHGRREWSKYERSKRSASKRHQSDLDFGTTYPLANSHGNAYQESSSHSKYTELYSKFHTGNNLDVMSCSAANSHEKHDMKDIRDRGYGESSKDDNLTWNTRVDMNYEIANSHSNYRVFYDSQSQHQGMPSWASELWTENPCGKSHVKSEELNDSGTAREQNSECEVNMDQPKKNDQDSQTTCDIEQCLVQIEESLLNIEQNLLHVQDLDIPELRNLLYKSPSIERSLFEVQDLLYADGIVPVIASNGSMSVDSEEEKEENENEEEEEVEELWIEQNLVMKDNEDGNESAAPLNSSNEESSDMANINGCKHSKSADDHYIDWINGSNILKKETRNPNVRMSPEKAMNFVPNSLGKTLPRRIVLDEVKDNIKLCSSESRKPTIDYNLNSTCAEKKSLFRDKCYSRTNSLDENSIFQNLEFGNKQENSNSSLQDLFFESARLTASAKAWSEGTLQVNQGGSLRRDRRGSHEELLQAVGTTAEDFRRRLANLATHQLSILGRQKRMISRSFEETSRKTVSQTRERSPTRSKRQSVTTTKAQQDRDNKSTSCDKRKKKKASGRTQNTESALVPSKLISLSLSLLLAALLQAVRCLTDLVEDAFRSVSYDRNGLLQ